MRKNFKPFNRLTKERTKHINKLFKAKIELYEWQHPIRWCHKYDITKEECKLWLAAKIADHAKTPKNTLDYVQYCLGEFGKRFQMDEELVNKTNEFIEKGDNAEQVAFNILNLINFSKIELISIDEDYFITI